MSLQTSVLKNIASNTLGNVLEWYDFTLYGTLAVIIAKVYFPEHTPIVSLLLTFAVFAVGFFMRPLGGIIYGHIGDRFGRRKALLISIVMMTIPTMLLGLLPGYAALGLLSSICIVIIRLLQGLAVGGEFTGTMSFLVESAPANRRGLFGSYALVGVLAGILLGIAMISLVSILLTEEQFTTWGWRIPFLLSGIFGFTVWVLRKHMQETTPFLKKQKTQGLAHIPVVESMINDKLPIFKGFLITIFNSFAFYILLLYLVTYFNRVLGISLSKANAINLYMVTLTLLLVPIAGWLSDYMGRKKIMGFAALASIIIAYPLNIYVLNNNSLITIALVQIIPCILLAMYLGPMSTTLAELMPTEVRYTSVSIAYNTALALFGGTAPLLNTFIIDKLQVKTAPGILLTLSAIISFIGILFIRETYNEPLK